MNLVPYLLVATLGSRITTMPESLLVRIRRPTPCLSFKMATGTDYS